MLAVLRNELVARHMREMGAVDKLEAALERPEMTLVASLPAQPPLDPIAQLLGKYTKEWPGAGEPGGRIGDGHDDGKRTPQSKWAIKIGLGLTEPFETAHLEGHMTRKAAHYTIVRWKNIGWVEKVSWGAYKRTAKFGGAKVFESEPVPDVALSLKVPATPERNAGYDSTGKPRVYLKESAALERNEQLVAGGKKPIEFWTCEKCKYTANAPSFNMCRKCDAWRVINGTSPLNGYRAVVIDTMPSLTMIDKIRKVVMGMGPNAEWHRRDLVALLKQHVSPWTPGHDNLVARILSDLTDNGETTRRGRSHTAQYRVADMKPVSASDSGALVGKLSAKEDEWRKLRGEMPAAKPDVLEAVGVERK